MLVCMVNAAVRRESIMVSINFEQHATIIILHAHTTLSGRRAMTVVFQSCLSLPAFIHTYVYHSA